MKTFAETTLRGFALGLCSVAALAAAAPAFAAGEIKIRFAHSLSSTEPAHLAAEFFAKNVAERTNNRVQIQVFPSEQLGSGKDVNEMIRQGANVMNVTDPGYLSDFVPDIGILNGPYVVKNPAEYQKLVDSDWFKGIEKKLEAAGFKLIMANGFFGERHLIADKPVRSPKDIAGMTVRVPPNTEAERRLIEIWQEILGIDRVGIHDNFFDLGGNSLTGLQVMARAEGVFGSRLDPVSLYDGPTVSALARLLAAEDAAEAPLLAERASRGERRRRKRRGLESAPEEMA